MRIVLGLLFCLTLCVSSTHAVDDKKIIDMTYPFAEDTLHWPTAKPFHLEKVSEGRTAAGFWYSSYNYGGSEHVGTHLDAPFHFAEGKWTTDQIPLARTIGPGVIIDVRRAVQSDRDYLLSVQDIRRWEKRFGRIPNAAIVIMYSGWGKHWSNRKLYFGTDEAGDVVNLHFPGFSKEAAEFLIRQRAVKAVGVDTPSIDHGPSRDFIVHQTLGAANVPIFENVAALDRLPSKSATIFAIPMKIQGGSGAPLRIFAQVP
jgi:kynurenine formamidase